LLSVFQAIQDFSKRDLLKELNPKSEKRKKRIYKKPVKFYISLQREEGLKIMMTEVQTMMSYKMARICVFLMVVGVLVLGCDTGGGDPPPVNECYCDFTSWKRPLKLPCPKCNGLLVYANKREAQCTNCQESFLLETIIPETVE
jgi:ssDNA-binding Zn-finger/Zn-ribbon topoisomerase 1